MKLCKCGAEFEPLSIKDSTIEQSKCFDCLIEQGRKMRERQLKKEKKEWNQEKKKIKTNLKTLGEWEKDARDHFQAWIRYRDGNRNCISCGSPTSSPYWDAGHYFKAEIFSGLIFDESNCHKQCRKCNYYRDGNEAEYRIGLVARYGSEYVKNLEEKANSNRFKKYTREEYESIKNHYKQKLKHDKEKDRIADSAARIRNDFIQRGMAQNRTIDREN